MGFRHFQLKTGNTAPPPHFGTNVLSPASMHITKYRNDRLAEKETCIVFPNNISEVNDGLWRNVCIVIDL
jgi:hypothetical protein